MKKQAQRLSSEIKRDGWTAFHRFYTAGYLDFRNEHEQQGYSHDRHILPARLREIYAREIGPKPGQSIIAVPREQLAGLRAMGHAMHWDTSKEPYPPGVAHP